MISGFSPVPVNTRREIPLTPIPEFYGGDERYLYVPNFYDQTVSVIDTDTDTVTTTITLTAGKDFSSIIYRAIDKSVYVFGVSYYDRIDADPDSGTFNTVVQSGASSVNGSSQNLTYLPWPLDLIANSGGSVRMHKFKDHNDATAAGKTYNTFVRNSGIATGTPPNSNVGPVTFGHAIGWARLAPKAGLMFFRSEQSYKYRVLCSSKNIDTNGEFTFVQEPWQMDLDRLGLVGNGYIFGNMVLPGSSGSVYGQVRGQEAVQLTRVLVGGSGGVTPSFAELCPIYGKSEPRALYCYAGKTTTSVAVMEVGFNTYNDQGDLVRTAYKAANETGTDSMLFNHRNNKLYVRGYNSGTLPGTCNLIHVYDMTQAIGSMYLTSITVGNLQSTTTQRNNPTSSMIFNQTKYYDASHIIL